MKVMKGFSVILGILLIIGGLFCIFSPVLTYSSLAWIIGFSMLINAIGDICAYSENKELGFADGWTLAGAIISILFAIILCVSNILQLAVISFIAIFVGIWVLVRGVMNIATAVKIHKYRKTIPEENRGHVWLVSLIMGILMAAIGVLSLFNPIIVALTIGILMGIEILLSGVRLLTSAFELS